MPGFELTQFVCATGRVPVPIDEFVLLPGEVAKCSAVNQLGNWTAVKSSDPPSGTRVVPGDEVEYTVTALQLFEGGVSADVSITDHLAEVLPYATLVPGSLAASAGTVAQSGTDLVWTIDSLTGTETLTYRVRVDDAPTA